MIFFIKIFHEVSFSGHTDKNHLVLMLTLFITSTPSEATSEVNKQIVKLLFYFLRYKKHIQMLMFWHWTKG